MATVTPPINSRRQLRLVHVSVSELAGSGTPAQQLQAAGIDAQHIAMATASLVDGRMP